MVKKNINALKHQDIYNLVKQIPEGRVATYGQIANLLGFPRHARQIGYALAALENDNDTPWHRVINSKGELSHRGSGGEEFQRIFLEEEDVVFNLNGRISLKDFQWQVGLD